MIGRPYIPVISLLPPHLTASADYEAGPYTVRFSAGHFYATLMVSTMEDNTTELSEYFKVVITSTDQPGRVEIGSPNMAFITIEDNDPGVHAHADHAIGFVFLQRCGVHVLMCVCMCD